MLSPLTSILMALSLFGLMPRGHLVIVGGGGTPDVVFRRALELAGGPDSSVVVIPWASQRETAGESTVGIFRSLGARDVHLASRDRAGEALEKAKKADLIWMPGGSQNRLMDALRAVAGLEQTISERFRAGGVVGGTSAGAAVMSPRMLTGEGRLDRLERETIGVAPGLGLASSLLIDQHFHRRRRFNRLLSAVLDHPSLVGVGIDERTAIVVHGRSFEVFGESSALVVDARRARVGATESGRPHAAQGILVHALTAGTRYDLARGPRIRTK